MNKNGQPAALNLNNEQLQVIISGKFGDGCLVQPTNCKNTSYYLTNSIHKDYCLYKQCLLGNLTTKIWKTQNRGYKKADIYSLRTLCSTDIYIIKNMTIEEALSYLDELGIALWIYDDGSLHKKKKFYNINTQKFPKEIQYDLFVPFFKKYSIEAIPTIERKKDGRDYWYLRVSAYKGAYEISCLLRKYHVPCFDYKIWSSETIQKWSKLQVQLKSTPVEPEVLTASLMHNLMYKYDSTEDIVRTLAKAKERYWKRISRNNNMEINITYPEARPEVPDKLKEIMENAGNKYCHKVPIIAEAEIGKEWIH